MVRPTPSDRCPVCLSICPLSETLVHYGQTDGWIKMPLDTEVGLGPRHIVLDGDRVTEPIHENGHSSPSPHFSAHVYCDQTAGWIRMPLGTEIDLGPSDVVLDGNPALPTEGGTTAPTFRTVSIVAKRSPIPGTAELLSDLGRVQLASD